MLNTGVFVMYFEPLTEVKFGLNSFLVTARLLYVRILVLLFCGCEVC